MPAVRQFVRQSLLACCGFLRPFCGSAVWLSQHQQTRESSANPANPVL
jgi:hypothetical protein